MMVTRCPQCATAFRVTMAQLEARQGQVRCGRCDSVFDARKTLSAEPDPRTAPQPHVAEKSVAAEPGEEIRSAAATPQPLEHDSTAPALELDFGPRKWRTSWLWWPASALALLALAAQAAFYFRGEIALVYPQVKPLLKEFCSDLGCEVPLPKRPELMSIESSDLQADPANPGVMVLSATLRNRAAFPQEHPALELTLTDDRDQALSRRVLNARDFLGQGVKIEPGFPANTEIPVKVFIEAVSIKPTGYRLYLFYP